MTDILLFPCNGNARGALEIIEFDKELKLAGFLDDNRNKKGSEIGFSDVVGGKNQLIKHPTAKILAVPGRPDNYTKRAGVIASLGVCDDRWISLIHPSAHVSSLATVGRNCLIMAGVVIEPGVTIGNHCVILPNTVISHDTRVGAYALIGSNVSISGSVTIGNNAYIGTGTRIIQEVSIGEKAMSGIGSVVIRSVNAGEVVVGNPAKVIRQGAR